jgi:hypothetical protein
MPALHQHHFISILLGLIWASANCEAEAAPGISMTSWHGVPQQWQSCADGAWVPTGVEFSTAPKRGEDLSILISADIPEGASPVTGEGYMTLASQCKLEGLKHCHS